MGNSDNILYEENKIDIHLCRASQSQLINNLINSLFPNENLEIKEKIKIKDNNEYIYLKGVNYGQLNQRRIEEITNAISNNRNTKNIVICFLDNNAYFNTLKNNLLQIIEENRPFVIFVKINEFSQDIGDVKKLSQINIIKYFGNSENNINDTNTQRTYNILYSKILQIDGYLNERGTIFRDYLFGLMNNAQGEINENMSIDNIIPGNRSALNIFLFGNPRAGKSRFINLSMNELISRERYSSEHTTKKFTEYELPMGQNNEDLGQIVLYDSPGLTEDQNIIKEFNELIKNKLTYFSLRKEIVPILLFFIKKDDGISNTTINFIKELNNKNFIIFFIITHSQRNSEGSRRYRDTLIHRLSRDRILTNKNLIMLNNNGENILSVNLKSDVDTGVFYGFKTIYQKIFELFPRDFIENIEEANNLNNLNRLLGYISYKDYFFLKNCSTKEDFLSRIRAKVNDKIYSSAAIASLFGLNPIPFIDIPIIIVLEIGLIKYLSKVYNIDEKQINEVRLLWLGPTDNIPVILLNTCSQVLRILQIADIVPFVGSCISLLTNFGTIIAFGKAIQKHLENLLGDEGVLNIIKNILKDYRGIYLQLRDNLSNRERFNIE